MLIVDDDWSETFEDPSLEDYGLFMY